ncbi:MAG: FtsX-like permease family protein [Spirochaetaceae bacterium]|nr:MAG: FtsX-like permease family protein [Spirochaetaceae bacterium]
MFSITRLAIRNLAQHRAKTIIVGSIISLGVIVLIVGNSFMETARLGIERAFINNYTGHVMITGLSRGDISLFGVQSPGGVEETPVLPSVAAIREFSLSLDPVVQLTPQLTTFGQFGLDDVEGRTFGLLFGIDAETYFDMFQSARVVEGRLPEPGERAMLMSVQRAEALVEAIARRAERDGIEPERSDVRVGDRIAISSFGTGGFRIRLVPLVGIYEPTSGEAVGSEFINFVDAETIRSLTGLSTGTGSEIVIREEERTLLDAEDFDLLFADDGFDDFVFDDDAGEFSDDWDAIFDGDREADAEPGEPTEADLAALAEAAGSDSGPWNFLLLRLDRTAAVPAVVTRINAFLEDEGIAARAWDWEQAAGPFATTADIVRIVFNVAIIIVGVVAAIVIMNTLVISVMERTAEIGTMRALGAGKVFVWRLFFTESLVITGVFGLIGMGLGSLITGVLYLIGIPATTTFLEVLFAGPELRPVVSWVSLLGSVGIVATVAILAHIYPVMVALRVQPVRAMKVD